MPALVTAGGVGTEGMIVSLRIGGFGGVVDADVVICVFSVVLSWFVEDVCGTQICSFVSQAGFYCIGNR